MRSFKSWPWPRILIIVGLAGLLLGALDPLEGSVIILAGSALAMGGALLATNPQRKLLVTSCILTSIGVATLFGLSAIGGIGGTSGRSIWWILVLAPYPIGWIVGLVGTIRTLRHR